jgi:hypothetical protein
MKRALVAALLYCGSASWFLGADGPPGTLPRPAEGRKADGRSVTADVRTEETK